MDINAGVNQEGEKKRAGINKTDKSNSLSKAYANRVQIRARQRMEKISRNIKVVDAIQAVSRFKILELPLGLRSKLIQRILYFRGSLMFYKDFDLERFFCLPYALTAEDDQCIDFYGQYTLVKPNSFNGKSTDNRNVTKKSGKGKDVYLGTITRRPVYDMEELEALIKVRGIEWCQENLCVIIRDYTQQNSEYNAPRSELQEPFIDIQAEILPMIRTAMIKACMPKLIKASDEGVVNSLLAELETIESCVIEGRAMIPVTAFQDLQEIDSKDAGRIIETMAMMYQSADNIRKTFLGVPNDGAFKKNAHILQDEQDKNAISSDAVLEDSFDNLKESFDLVNKLFGLNIKVEKADSMNNKSNGAELKNDNKGSMSLAENENGND